MSVAGKKILLGITGCIAAYKACYLIRLLKKAGAEVKVVLTKSGEQFVTKTTLETLSDNPVATEMFPHDRFASTHHISYAEWADLIVVAPATGNFIGKVAGGIADDLLTTIVMAKQSDLLIATAMNTEMFLNPIVQQNIEKLQELRYLFIMPESGELACKTIGVGRLAEPEEIFGRIEQYFSAGKALTGKKLVVTAGPTVERLDPVRFLSNFSSGKMGYAIAAEAAFRGAEVILISGPTSLPTPAGVARIDVESAEQMLKATRENFKSADGAILCAAVADFRPAEYAAEKIPHPVPDSLKLTANPDIAAELGSLKSGRQFTIGFALETDSNRERALSKLRRKNFDLIVMNNPTIEGVEFGSDDNIATLISADGEIEEPGRMAKRTLAGVILDKAAGLLQQRSQTSAKA